MIGEREIEELKNWGDKFPPRALKWATLQFPMETGKTYTLYANDSKKERIGLLSLLRTHKKDYYQFLEQHGMKQTVYDRAL